MVKKKGPFPKTFILNNGSLESPADPVTPGTLSAIYGIKNQNKPFLPDLPKTIHGRRLALANWIASKDNPLTARVMVNRIWLTHFSKAIAANPNNFGVTGAKPTHPQLLDYLSQHFIKSGWSVKKLHRLIMLSDTYKRAASHPNHDSIQTKDPDNKLLAYFPARRLSAEEIRDAILLVTNELNLEQGGLPIRPEINMEVAMQPRHIMGSVAPAYQPSPRPEQRHRRTIYAERIRTLRNPSLEIFNLPSFDLSCERRDASTVTPQVFDLFNSTNSRDRSIALAKFIQSKHPENLTTQINALFQF